MRFWKTVAFANVIIMTQVAVAQQIVGGYSAISVSDAEIISIAKAAVKIKNAPPESKRVKLLSIIDAQSQVVAGMNFKLCIAVKQAKHKMRVQAVVYRDLSGKLELTEWTPKGC